MPAGTVDVSVAGEWSFAQTLRHLVLATDVWLGRADPASSSSRSTPSGWPARAPRTTAWTCRSSRPSTPSYAEVLEVRADRVAMVRDFLAARHARRSWTTARANPWAPAYPETTLSCLHVILEEEWEHHRYAVRDLDAIEADARATR